MDKLEEVAEKLESYYWECLSTMVNIDDEIKDSFSVLLTQNFLLIVKRTAEAVKTDERVIGINSLGFIGTIAVKS